jgi:hypothetical protein
MSPDRVRHTNASCVVQQVRTGRGRLDITARDTVTRRTEREQKLLVNAHEPVMQQDSPVWSRGGPNGVWSCGVAWVLCLWDRTSWAGA